MRYKIGFLIISAVLFGCQQGKRTSDISKISTRCTMPDQETFFPLVPGSVWYYADYVGGERDPASVTKDSILRVVLSDTGSLITVTRFSQNSTDTVYYFVNCKGEVYKFITLDEQREPFALLNPGIGNTIGNMIYDGYCSSNTSEPENCFRLEEYPYDSATTQIEKMKWQFFFFMRGIGIVSNGGDELVTRLEKYKIGQQEFKTYP